MSDPFAMMQRIEECLEKQRAALEALLSDLPEASGHLWYRKTITGATWNAYREADPEIIHLRRIEAEAAERRADTLRRNRLNEIGIEAAEAGDARLNRLRQLRYFYSAHAHGLSLLLQFREERVEDEDDDIPHWQTVVNRGLWIDADHSRDDPVVKKYLHYIRLAVSDEEEEWEVSGENQEDVYRAAADVLITKESEGLQPGEHLEDLPERVYRRIQRRVDEWFKRVNLPKPTKLEEWEKIEYVDPYKFLSDNE